MYIYIEGELTNIFCIPNDFLFDRMRSNCLSFVFN